METEEGWMARETKKTKKASPAKKAAKKAAKKPKAKKTRKVVKKARAKKADAPAAPKKPKVKPKAKLPTEQVQATAPAESPDVIALVEKPVKLVPPSKTQKDPPAERPDVIALVEKPVKLAPPSKTQKHPPAEKPEETPPPEEPKPKADVEKPHPKAQCPYCEAEISDSARKCRYCGEWVVDLPVAKPAASSPATIPTEALPSFPSSNSGCQPVPVPQPAASSPAPIPTETLPTFSALTLDPQQVTGNGDREESVAFAVVTLLCYIFLYPIGLLLNLVGLIAGPRRGCFFSLAIVFLLLPLLAVLVLTAMGVPVLDRIVEILEDVF
jgi:hypothetical protein